MTLIEYLRGLRKFLLGDEEPTYMTFSLSNKKYIVKEKISYEDRMKKEQAILEKDRLWDKIMTYTLLCVLVAVMLLGFLLLIK